MEKLTTPPKVFISYSWTPKHLADRVHDLATRMRLNGINVILDIWDLQEGQDKYLFMEQMVTDPTVHRVLLICTKDYMEKANQREGGVGTESQIVSREVYEKARQTKFIPVIFEKDTFNQPYAPAFLQSRIHIDLGQEETYDDNYDKLIRNIFEKPAAKRPPLGEMPLHLQQDDKVLLPTTQKISALKNALYQDKQNTDIYLQDFLDSFIGSVKSFTIEDSELNRADFDEVVVAKINQMRPLRDDWISFLETYHRYSAQWNMDRLHQFLELLMEYFISVNGLRWQNQSMSSVKVDHYRFFYYEFFLTLTASLIASRRFNELAYIVRTPFALNPGYSSQVEEIPFSYFRNYVWTLKEHRNKRKQAGRLSVTADIIREHAHASVPFHQLQEADALLYYLNLLHYGRNGFQKGWYPETLVFNFYELPLMEKARSARTFEKLLPLFDVLSVPGLQAKAVAVSEIDQQLSRFELNLPLIAEGLNLKKLSTIL